MTLYRYDFRYLMQECTWKRDSNILKETVKNFENPKTFTPGTGKTEFCITVPVPAPPWTQRSIKDGEESWPEGIIITRFLVVIGTLKLVPKWIGISLPGRVISLS
jgi:hypothetical protein